MRITTYPNQDQLLVMFNSNDAEDKYECRMLMLRERASSSRHRLRCRRTSGVQLRAQTFLPEKEQTAMRKFYKTVKNNES